MLIVAAAAVLIAAFAIVAGAFNHRNDMAEESLVIDEDEVDEEAAPEGSNDQDDNGLLSAYYDILIENESAIKAYSDRDGGDEKSVAMSDISGDGVPELMFFSEGDIYSSLRVFTYLDGHAVECTMYFPYLSAEENDEQRDELFDIYMKDSTSYMIYTGKDPGIFYIADYICDDTAFYTSVRFKFRGSHEIMLDKVVHNAYRPNDDYPVEDTKDNNKFDIYELDREEVSSERGIAEFKEDREDFDRLIMYHGNAKNFKVFEATKNKSTEALTFDEAIEMCK